MAGRRSRTRTILGVLMIATAMAMVMSMPTANARQRGDTNDTTESTDDTTESTDTTDTTATTDPGSTETTATTDTTATTVASDEDSAGVTTTTGTTVPDDPASSSVIGSQATAAPPHVYQKGEPYQSAPGDATLQPLANENDADSDDVPNASDNCQFTFNPNQADGDGDGIGNRCDSGFVEQDGIQGNLYENVGCFQPNQQLPLNDDGSQVTSSFLPTPLNFLGNTYTSAFVNNNGNITFENPLSTFTPFEITANTPPIIAPFLADVDTRAPADPDTVDANDADGHVFYGVALHAPRFGGRNVFCVTWEYTGYFAFHPDQRDTFQLLLVERSDIAPGDFDIYFNYAQLQWETGDASGGTNGFGGTSAGAGYSAGTGDPDGFLSMPCSLINGACLDSNSSTGLRNTSTNSFIKGRHIFEIRNGGQTFHGRIHGAVTMFGGTFPAVQALVELCPILESGQLGRCRTNTTTVDGYDFQNLPPGDYVVRAFPKRFGKTKAQTDPKKFNAMATSLVGPYTVEDGEEVPVALLGNPPPIDPLPVTARVNGLGEDQDRVVDLDSPGLGDAPPPGTTFGKTRGGSNLPHGVSGKPVDLKVTLPCPGSSNPTFEVLRDGVSIAVGSLTETVANNVSTYAAKITIATPGPIQVKYNIPGCANDQFDAYIDPSGFVVDQNGDPIAGAVVILTRSDFVEGPYGFVPDGSSIMSPGNRVNPDETDEDGHFGWDVLPGFYKVAAVADGCTSATTGALDIPPPAVNLVIELNCSSSTTATTAPTVTTDEPLARTGADVGTTLEVAILLIVAGTWLVVGGRGLSIRTTRRIGRHG